MPFPNIESCTLIRLNGATYALERTEADGLVLREASTGELRWINRQELLEMFLDGRLGTCESVRRN